jgi:hypothetical protein
MATTTPNFGWVVPTSTDLVKDGATAIETLGDSIDASLLDLKGGTSGQVLKKNSNTDMDFVWGTDSAGMTNPMTTTGDIIYSSSGSTPARLGIGTTGQVLNVTAGVPAWATPAAAGGWTLLTSGNLPAANSVVLSSISQSYKNLRLILKKIQNTTDAENFNLRFNGSSSAVYDWGWDTGVMTMTQTFTRLLTNIDNTTQNGITVIDILDYANSTTMKYCIVNGWNTNTLTTSTGRNMYMGGWNQTSAISSLTVYGEGGSNFDGGSYELYGEN